MMTRMPSSLLNTALATPEVRPLCQKPPSPMMVTVRLPNIGCTRGVGREAEAVAEHGVADVERRQRGEGVAADVGRDVELAQLALPPASSPRTPGAPGSRRRSPADAAAPARRAAPRRCSSARRATRRRRRCGWCRALGAAELDEARHAGQHDLAGVLARHRQHVLAVDACAVARRRGAGWRAIASSR